MICQRCAKDVPNVHTCTPSDLVRKLEETVAARTKQASDVTLQLRRLQAEIAESAYKQLGQAVNRSAET